MKSIRFLILALLCAVAQGAWAQPGAKDVDNETDLRNAVKSNGIIRLKADIMLSGALIIDVNGTVGIDLNGFTLNRGLTNRGDNGQVISVRSGSTLTLANGTLTGGWGGNSGGVLNDGTVQLTGVTITGCTGDDRGGGISNNGTLTMTGGALTNNVSNDRMAPEGGGGIFNATGATMTLTNVTITGNEAKVKGGGGICNYGTLTLDGCIVTGNSCQMNGGGIWTAASATLKMQGAMTVTDNTTAGNETNNLFLKTDAVITVTGALYGSSIGVNMESLSGTFTSGYNAHNSGIAPEDIFTPDLSLSTAVSLASNEAQLSLQSNINYIERSWDEENKQVVNTVKTLTTKIGYGDTPGNGEYKEVAPVNGWFILGGYYLIDNDTSNDNEHEYYVVRGDVKINRTMYMIGKNVHLILCDGAKLTLAYGILMYGPRTLYIHSQSHGAAMGKLIVEKGHSERAAGIGSDWYTYWSAGDYGMGSQDPRFEKVTVGSNGTAGSLEVHGGDIYAKGNASGAGIGGAHFTQGTAVTIYGGKVEAHGSADNDGAAGIGSGWKANGGSFTIYDGYVQAYGGSSSAGIGGGYKGKSGPVTIYGGKVEAHGGDNGSGIGGGSDNLEISDITVNGGEVYAYGGNDAAGIGGGWCGSGSNVTVNGGKVVAKGSGNGAGIGSGSDFHSGLKVGSLTVTGGEVYAYGGVDAAGIGGGEDAGGGTVNISGGYVYAEGNDYGAGIGGGQGGDGGNVTITGGIVVAKAGRNETECRAIGPGEGCDEYGSLTLGDSMMVTSERKFSAAERKNACWYRTQVRVEPCDHQDATATVNDGSTHSVDCNYCITSSATHTFGEDSQCAACGLIRLEDAGDNSALFTKWADGDEHDFLLSGRKLVPYEESSRAYTVCLPFDMDLTGHGDDLMLYTLSYIKDGSEMVFTQTEKKIEAGKPYLIVIHQGELELLGSGKLAVTADEGVRVYDWTNREQPLGWWRGTLTKIESADAAEMMAYSLQSVGDFRRIRPDTPQAWWGAFRSMYCPDELPATNRFTINKGTFGGFGGQTVTVTFEGDADIQDGTGISEVAPLNDKGQMINDAWYDLQGRKVNGQLPRGIYINNGRKQVIK